MSELTDILAGMGARVSGPAASGGFPIPNATFPPTTPISTVPRETLNNAAPNIAQQQLQCAAAGSYIGFGYGRCRTAIRITYPVVDYTHIPLDLLVPGFIGRGPIDAIESVQLDNATLPTGITHTDYTGAAGQAADASLVAAWGLQFAPKFYADTLPGIAYTVLRLQQGPQNRIGNFTVVARHLKVYDPRQDETLPGGSIPGPQRLADPSTWAWSQNPVLALAHFLTTDGYGPEETLDWSTVMTCADIADQTITADGVTQTRRQIGIFFDQPQEVDAIEETLRSYAGVFIDRGSGATVVLIPDAPTAVTFAFTNATPSNYIADSLQWAKRGRANSPTVVTIRYTDVTQTPWATQEVTVKAPGVDAGTEAWIETSIDWPGCQSPGMAYREAVRRLNEFTIADVTGSLIGTDEAVQVRRGDVVTVTDSEGFTAKPFRVKDIPLIAPGRWQVSLTEYQAGLYSDTIYNGPVIGDTSLPSPSVVPTVTGLALAEEVFQTLGGGIYSSRIVATWTAPTWPFTLGYKLTVLDGSRVIDSTFLTGSNSIEYRTAALPEGISYTVNVQVQSVTGALGTAAYASLIVQGTKLPPGDVPSVSGVVSGSAIVLTWGAAVDVDLTGYEVRVGSTSDTWDTAAAFVVRTDAATRTVTISGLVPATYRCFVKARDSIRSTANPYGQYSTNAVYADFTITVIGILALGREIPINLGVSNNAYEIAREGQTTKVATAIGDFATLFPSALSTYSLPLARYSGSVSTGIVRTGWYDLGQLLTGTFVVSWDATSNGALTVYLSTDGVNNDAGSTVVGTPLQATARYIYIGQSFFFNGSNYLFSNSNPVLRVIIADPMAANTFRMNDKAYTSPGRDATAADTRTALGLAAIATSGSVTSLSGLGAGVATFLQTANSANLRAALGDETGTGAAVFADSPTFDGTVSAEIVNIYTSAYIEALQVGGAADIADTSGIGNTAWTASTPTPTAGTGTFTTVSATFRYKRFGKFVAYRGTVTITTNGTAALSVIVPLPVTAVAAFQMGYGRAAGLSGKMLQAYLNDTTHLTIVNYDNTYPGATGETLWFGGMYEAA